MLNLWRSARSGGSRRHSLVGLALGWTSLFLASSLAQASPEPVCRPFRAYLQMPLPPEPHIVVPTPLPPHWESQLMDSIAQSPSQNSFRQVYKDYLRSSKTPLSDEERYRWLACMAYYIHDHSGGVPQEWTAIVDNRPSRVIYPQNIDQEIGLNPKNESQNGIPSYLRIPESRGEVSSLQKELLKDYGILAIDHTDQHSALVLREFSFLLKNGLGKALIRQLPDLHYIYAFSGHDPHAEIAAYHHQVKAISVAGVSSYPEKGSLSSPARIELLAAIAHEIGHAFLFDHVSPEELKDVAERFGKWPLVASDNQRPLSLYAPYFFRSFKASPPSVGNSLASGKNKISKFASRLENETTEYAAKNIHEWFAEAFAAKVLLDLGEAGHLGKGWRAALVRPPNSEKYWANYNRLSPAFRSWLDGKIRGVLVHPLASTDHQRASSSF